MRFISVNLLPTRKERVCLDGKKGFAQGKLFLSLNLLPTRKTSRPCSVLQDFIEYIQICPSWCIF